MRKWRTPDATVEDEYKVPDSGTGRIEESSCEPDPLFVND
jgi:hypothetical protein